MLATAAIGEEDETADRVYPLTRTMLAGGEIAVAGPPGYCIDRQTRRDDGLSGFVLIAPCTHTDDGAEPEETVEPLIVSVTVGPRGAARDLPEPAALAELAGAPLIEGQTLDGLLLVHLSDGGRSAIPDGDARHWRGAFLQNGHLIGLALYAPEGSTLADAGGAAFLASLRAGIEAMNRMGPR
ncbi:dihydroxy-acid dehydratase [Citreimonas sp.]|uniref:dihydroxy-acid dehydratase n=1 Tax=Citreimonas sp. TaxID=3036715 RepID=UPI0035C7BDEF